MKKENRACILIYKKRKITGSLERKKETTQKRPQNNNPKPFELPPRNAVYFDK